MGKGFREMSAKEMEEHSKLLEESWKIAREKYKECGEGKNHKFPYNLIQNFPSAKNIRCAYCHYHLSYSSDEVDSILEERKNWSPERIPMDAPILMDKRINELSRKEMEDFFYAAKIEFNKLKKSKLEKLL